MAAYLQRCDDTSRKEWEVPDQIQLSKPEITIGWRNGNDVVVPVLSGEEKDGYLSIKLEADGNYYIEARNFPLFLNGYPIAGRVFLQHDDCIRIADVYKFRFIEQAAIKEVIPQEQETIEELIEEEVAGSFSPIEGIDKKITPRQITHPIGSRRCRNRLSESDEGQTKEENLKEIPLQTPELESNLTRRVDIPKIKRRRRKTGEMSSLKSDDLGDAEVQGPEGKITTRRRRTLQLQDIAVQSNDPGTLMLNITRARVSKTRAFPELISPTNGQILPLKKDRFIVGRMNTCDLCIMDQYISRQQLEFSKTAAGFLLKNIGKNEVIVEKRGFEEPGKRGRIISQEKILKPNETTLLTQEAAIMLGAQILYYFNVDIPQMQTCNVEYSILERKYKFYKHLAEQKHELLRAAQVQKILTPPKNVFEDLKVGVWFRYFAIDNLSGDFFLTQKTEDALFVCLGDVSGHGPTSALWASRISGMFDTLAGAKEEPQDVLSCINHYLIQKKNPKHTLYALVSVLKITHQNVEFCIAGNSVPPLYYLAREQKLTSLNTPSTPVGMVGPNHFKTYMGSLEFASGDMLILFTDGVTEAEMLDDGSQVEYHRVQEQIELQIHRQVGQEQFLDTFLSWLDHNTEIQDDVSMVLITRL